MKLFLRTAKNGALPSLYRMVKKPLEKDGGEIINKKYEQTIDSEFVLKIKWVNSNANEKTHSFLKKENKVNTAKVKIKIQN